VNMNTKGARINNVAMIRNTQTNISIIKGCMIKALLNS
jgi:hypothetical protein